MDFEWTDESLSLRAEAVAFGRSLSDEVIDDDRAGRFRADKWKRLADWGYFGLGVPESLGGAGVDPMSALLVTEGLGHGCDDAGLTFSACVQAWVLIPMLLRYGTDDQQRRHVPQLAAGTTIGAFAVTEPEAGSDAFAMRAHASAVDGGWSLEGRKTMITNAPTADLVLCFARTDESDALGGIAAFIVDANAPGVDRGPAMEKMGLRTSPLGDIALDGVFVAHDDVLGEVGGGMLVFNEAMTWERTWPSALQIGALERDLERARAYARQRKAFGEPISSFQSVANRIVDMKVRLEAGRLLVYHAAWLKTQGRSALTESALAKLWASEAAVQSSLDLVQVHGGYGYMTEAGVERRVRDAVASRIYSGTSEIQRAILGRTLGL